MSFDFERLPPPGFDLHLLRMIKRNEHVGVAVTNQVTDDVVFSMTLHCVEARKLAKALLEIANGSEGATTFVEGTYLGGPPSRDDMVRR